MSTSTTRPDSFQFREAFGPFLIDKELPFASVLPASVIEQAFADEGVRFGTTSNSVFTPALTLWAFLSQVISPSKSCRAAVLRVCTLLLALERGPCSADTAAYCRARAKLPAIVLKRLALQVGRELEEQAPQDWLWHGRHVSLVDGTTMTLPDTAENQAAFPQAPTQAPGVGFPIIRMVLLLSFATAAIRAMAYGRYSGKKTGETALLRPLLDQIPAGEVLVADRYYCSYWMVALALARGQDVAFRMHQRRDFDFRRGQRLGHHDHLVVWHRPQRPEWMDEETYATIPETLTVRELEYQISEPGCRTEEVVIVTTMTDPELYRKEDIADLYHQRWHAEIDIRAIKQSLGLEHLSCKTPEMVERELWVHMLGYNLIRKVAAQVASSHGMHPREISFTATRQALDASWMQWTTATSVQRVRQGEQMLKTLSQAKVGDRPNRHEPRAVKRPKDKYDKLKEPRSEAKAKLQKRKPKKKKQAK